MPGGDLKALAPAGEVGATRPAVDLSGGQRLEHNREALELVGAQDSSSDRSALSRFLSRASSSPGPRVGECGIMTDDAAVRIRAFAFLTCTAPGFLDTRGGYQDSGPTLDRRS